MSDGHAHDIKKEVRGYIGVFIALAALTVLTVLASYIEVSHALHIVIAMAIAVTKGTLVCLYFMHLISERKLIYWTLSLTAAFFVVLMMMPTLTQADRLGH